jgi:hypothetical protein
MSGLLELTSHLPDREVIPILSQRHNLTAFRLLKKLNKNSEKTLVTAFRDLYRAIRDRPSVENLPGQEFSDTFYEQLFLRPLQTQSSMRPMRVLMLKDPQLKEIAHRINESKKQSVSALVDLFERREAVLQGRAQPSAYETVWQELKATRGPVQTPTEIVDQVLGPPEPCS